MAFRFPFSTLHELNLDWILEKVKKFAELIPPMEEAVDNVQEALDDATDAKEKAEQAVEDAAEAVATAEEAKEIAEQAAQGTIADGAVTTPKLADGAVTTAKLNSSLQTQINKISVLDAHKLYSTGDTTDRSAEIMSKLNTYGCCELQEGDFYIADSVILPNRSTLKGCGKTTRIMRDQTSSIYTMLATNGTAGNVTIKDLYIVGGNSTKPNQVTTSGETGLLVSGSGGKVTVENCNFFGLVYAGIATTSGLNELTSVQVSNSFFWCCGTGIACKTQGEYANVSNTNFISCYTGALVTGGNNKFSNCGFEDNYNGFSLYDDEYTGTNDGHGSAVGCSFNHNDHYAITVENINYGYVFSGCNIFDGDIYIYKSKGIMFDSCLIMGVKTGTALHSNFSLSSNPGLISITNCCCVFDKFTITRTGSNPFVFVKNNKTAEGATVYPADRYKQIGYAQLATPVTPGNYGDIEVAFPTPYPEGTIPYVFFTPQLDSTNIETGKIQFFLQAASNTGFTVRMFNNASINRSFNINWFSEIPE